MDVVGGEGKGEGESNMNSVDLYLDFFNSALGFFDRVLGFSNLDGAAAELPQ